MNRSHDRADVLLEKARGDVLMAARLLTEPDVPDWGPGFHAQQAAEKAIKAVLSAKGLFYPFSHDIKGLLKLVKDAGLALPSDAMDLPRLTPFGSTLRYDARLASAPHKPLDRAWVMEALQRTLAWAESILGKDKVPGSPEPPAKGDP